MRCSEALLEHCGQLIETLAEELGRIAGGAERLRETPDLCPLRLGEITEHLDEAGEEIALVEDDVHRHDHLEVRHHLIDALADALAELCR